jgi:hypothetical protein
MSRFDTVHVYADQERFRQLALMGELHCQQSRAGEIFSFNYDRTWLASADTIGEQEHTDGATLRPLGQSLHPLPYREGSKTLPLLCFASGDQEKRRAADGPIRLPAAELEELVISQVQSFLQSPQRMQDVLCDLNAGSVEIQQAADFVRNWAPATATQVRAVVPSVVKRVIVRDGRVELQLSKSAIREAVTGLRGNAGIAERT